jgi:hypothetical protein
VTEMKEARGRGGEAAAIGLGRRVNH